MIDEAKQKQITSEIKDAVRHLGPKTKLKHATLMFWGVFYALGINECPPHWTINLNCGRVDRMLKDGR